VLDEPVMETVKIPEVSELTNLQDPLPAWLERIDPPPLIVTGKQKSRNQFLIK